MKLFANEWLILVMDDSKGPSPAGCVCLSRPIIGWPYLRANCLISANLGSNIPPFIQTAARFSFLVSPASSLALSSIRSPRG